MAERSVQCCVTSPPYFHQRDYGHPDQIGDEPLPADYIAELVKVFREVKRVLRDDGTLWLNIGDTYSGGGRGGGVTGKPNKQRSNVGSFSTPGFARKNLLLIPERLGIALQDDGWIVRSRIVWHKPAPMTESVKDRPTNAHETVWLLSKKPNYFYDADAIRETPTGRTGKITSFGHVPDRNDFGRSYVQDGLLGANARNVWKIHNKHSAVRNGHYAQMPLELAQKCIKAGSAIGDMILDPFGGAGTTGFAAESLGREATMIELVDTYCALAAE